MSKRDAEPELSEPTLSTEAIVDTGKAGVEAPPPPGHETHPHKGGKNVKINSAELEILKTKAADAAGYYDQLLRARAEFDNYRRRVVQERQYAELSANERLFQKLIGVLDTFELASASAEKAETAGAILDGVKLVRTQLQNVLKESGLEEIDALNKPFDPNFHEAIQQVESNDHEEGTVIQQVRKGYKFKDRLLRPSSVIVSKKPESPAASS
jgi:molecular chaperone GrpE